MTPSSSWLNASSWTGQRLQEALNVPPQLVLSFYQYGILLRRPTEQGGTVEYPIDGRHLAETLASHLPFDSGLLSEDMLFIRREGVQETRISYRKSQRTGIWLEGSSEPLRVPLPDLVLIRRTNGNATPRYALFAVKERPRTLNTPLFHAPLPNVYASGSICWGSVRLDAQASPTLEPDWGQLLGSAFGNHAVSNKSKAYQADVRQQLLALDCAKKRTYPKKDLVSAEKVLGQIIEKDYFYE